MNSMIRYALTCMLSTLCLLSAHNVMAGIIVIVHPSNKISALSAEDVQKVYLGKIKHFPGGVEVNAVDQAEAEPVRKAFYQQVVRKEGSQLKAYWAKIIFTGDGMPPEVMNDSAAVKSWVASHPDGIGYIDESKVDQSVKPVFRLP